MSLVKFYSKDDILNFVKKRKGESKFGEALAAITRWEQLASSPQKYVLIGIPEDIGVRANYGNPGTSEAWKSALQVLCNIQKNELTKVENVLVLGEVNCDPEMKSASRLSSKEENYNEKLGKLVEQIDEKVAQTIQKIIEANKFPIVIGGGHNNSYGNLKGAFQALKKPVNCLNFDAHTDFRALEHRHSGNGFSYAFEEGYLERYFTFGLHRNYTSQFVFERLKLHSDRIKFSLFEDIAITQKISYHDAIAEAETFICGNSFGLELDLDAIEDMGSSAMTPGGFTMNDARRFISYFSNKEHCVYFHICEGAPGLGNFPAQVGKTISFLISDVIA
ncbi:formiminoglutamase [Ulvibacter sp. MAR_2010_11]|uniref:formimidoylglutamase n=1 Tax=Ulvibacter sp. MAR_2010_11 TaxID=1250229 RepID=UPI000C2C179D|nr:formimidoylglutamase [Ulvibacter sp. MAR_2010_11]PKA84534.1 formiminoglutamase [Ulvibacter sp. MAR_2010_11]